MKKFLLMLLPFIMFSCGREQRVYKSEPLDPEAVTDYPEQLQIEGLTWIATEKAYCITTCLQMVGEWAGIHEPIEYYNWLTGYSYGGFYKDRYVTFTPISDPMQGILFASGYLGLERSLYATGEKELVISGIKSFLAKGIPVMILYDYNVLTEDSFFFPHAALITGYTEDTFIYYEPGFHNEFTPSAGRGEEALIDDFLEGILSLHRNFGISEGYSFLVFHKTEKSTDTNAVWARNSKELKGVSIPFINLSTGARACRSLAEELQENDIPMWSWKDLLRHWFAFGAYSRSDNADFILERFGTEAQYTVLADSLRESAATYERMNRILDDPDKTSDDFRREIPPLLLEIADKELQLSKDMGKVARRTPQMSN